MIRIAYGSGRAYLEDRRGDGAQSEFNCAHFEKDKGHIWGLINGAEIRSQRTFLIMSNRSPTHKAAIEPWCVWLVGKSVCAGDTLSWHTMGSGLHGNLAAVYFRFIPSPVITQCGSVTASSSSPLLSMCHRLPIMTPSPCHPSCSESNAGIKFTLTPTLGALLVTCNVNTRHMDHGEELPRPRSSPNNHDQRLIAYSS